MEDDILFDDDFNEDLPYVSLDLDIKDVKLILESISQNAKLCHHDPDKKESLEYMESFLTKVILEYNFRID